METVCVCTRVRARACVLQDYVCMSVCCKTTCVRACVLQDVCACVLQDYVCACVCAARLCVQGHQLSILPPLCRALGVVVTLLLWGQLFAVDLGNDAMDTVGESLGFPRNCAPQHGCAPVWSYQSFTK